MDILYFLKVISRKWWLILLVSLISAIATYYFLSQQPKKYFSRVTISTGFIDEVKSTLIDEYGFQRPYIREFTVDNKFISLEEEFKSPQALYWLGYKLFLHDINSPKPFSNLERLLDFYSPEEIDRAVELFLLKSDSLVSLDPDKAEDVILLDMLQKTGYYPDTLKPNINAERYKETDNLRVEFTSHNPQLAAFAVNEISKDIIRYYTNIKQIRAKNTVSFFEEQADNRKNIMDSKISELNRFKVMNNISELSEQRSAYINKINELESQKEEAKKNIEANLKGIQNIDIYLTQGTKDYETIQLKNKAIEDLRKRRDNLLNKYIATGQNDENIRLELEMVKNELETQIKATASDNGLYTASSDQELILKKIDYEIELEGAKTSLSLIDAEITRLRTKLAELVQLEANVQAIEQQVTVASEEYGKVVTKLEDSKVALGGAENTLNIIEDGKVAQTPISQKKSIIATMAGLGTLALCSVLLFISVFFDRRYHSPQNIQRLLQENILEYVPQIQFQQLDLERYFNSVSQHEKDETFKQNLRKLRFYIENNRLKKWIFTSNEEGEGKTFIISALAYLFALNKHKVLVIDANFKHNGLTQMLMQEKQEANLTANELIKDYGLDKVFVSQKLIKLDEQAGVDVIGCYGNLLSPSEILSGKDFDKLLEELMYIYDYILIETPAMSQYSDTRELIGFCDAIMMVVSAETSYKSRHKSNISFLQNVPKHFAGLILNKAKQENFY
ncbi:MAG: AAA family ATPase [Chitinophagales bacterium]|nr:AAA family ATPase [Bacteroidota bacterium]MCB9042534.1 AAA family ATPase [Chitinophagales bacterium]